MERNTRIICTLGPRTNNEEGITSLIKAGANVFRMNMSHAQHDQCREVAQIIRRVAREHNRYVGILVDLQGPSIRTGNLEEDWQLEVGDTVEFRLASAEAKQKFSTTVNYEAMMQDIQAGKELVVDNGNILMNIDSVDAERATCTVKTAAKMTSRRHINLPGTALNLPALTEKDLSDLEFACEIEADFIAGSFVRDAEHVNQLRAKMEEFGGSAVIVSKIEDQQAIKNIKDIIKATDVIMVARGDLGIEIHVEELPVIQRKIVKDCHEIGRRVIVATHMLETMIDNPTPTRAEVTDVANAIFEGADAIMLSGETAVGKYPDRCVEIMDKISKKIETSSHTMEFEKGNPLITDRERTVNAAVTLAESHQDSALVVFTRRGIMANHVALRRPKGKQIFAFTEDEAVCRKLALSKGIKPIQIEFSSNPEETQKTAETYLIENGLISKGSTVVIVSDIFQEEVKADSVLFRQV